MPPLRPDVARPEAVGSWALDEAGGRVPEDPPRREALALRYRVVLWTPGMAQGSRIHTVDFFAEPLAPFLSPWNPPRTRVSLRSFLAKA